MADTMNRRFTSCPYCKITADTDGNITIPSQIISIHQTR